jgi:DNA-binding response OmpR family regulator
MLPKGAVRHMAHDTQRGTILLVDDNPDIRGFARVFLEDAGYVVVTATNGEEGLHFFEKYQSTIVLLLTDVVMPKINGLELAGRVLRIDSQLPVLFMSGDASIADLGLECLAKPFRPGQLVEIVSRLLNAKTRLETTTA